jgi:hypothetical protein
MYAMLREGGNSWKNVMLQPHVVMQTNIEYFLKGMAKNKDEM